MNAVGRSVFRVGIEIAECHHEKFDGSGYPGNIRGEEIPLSARIVAAADVFDALTSKRPYKEAWPIDKAVAYLQEQAGSHFDPAVVEACLRAMPKIMEIYDRHKHV
jgi:response regulator RpfG family c-di-GMP phosphodiesterase